MKIREAFAHNLGIKALALFLATVLWLFVTTGQRTEIDLALPVVFMNLPPGLTIVNRPPSRVDVRLAGPRILLLRLGAERLPVRLDLKGAGEGTTRFPEVESNLQTPPGVRVTRVTPAVIEVMLAKK